VSKPTLPSGSTVSTRSPGFNCERATFLPDSRVTRDPPQKQVFSGLALQVHDHCVQTLLLVVPQMHVLEPP